VSVVVSEIRRYPVKSMAGESLASAPVDSRGLVGDRWYAVVDEDARLASGKNSRRFRRRDAIFDYTSLTTDDGVRVSGPGGEWLVGDPDLDRALTTIMGDQVRVLAEDGTPHHDDREVSLVGTASLAWCREHLGVDADPRRIRPNLVVETTEPFIEETWSGGLTIGSVRLAVVQRIERCRMIDIAQEGLPRQGGWLKALGQTRDANLGVYLEVAETGTLRVGDEVLLTG
jgi:MOSC domain-containing protein